jgi:hypothetical protein
MRLGLALVVGSALRRMQRLERNRSIGRATERPIQRRSQCSQCVPSGRRLSMHTVARTETCTRAPSDTRVCTVRMWRAWPARATQPACADQEKCGPRVETMCLQRLQLDRQAMAVPSRDVMHTVPTHHLVPAWAIKVLRRCGGSWAVAVGPGEMWIGPGQMWMAQSAQGRGRIGVRAFPLGYGAVDLC